MDLSVKMQKFQGLGACLILFVGTTFVNKYVLSILKFTYPTIFQGWQTLVGAIVLRALALNSQVSIDFSAFQRSTLVPWLPGMILYVLSIYSGSVALSKLPIPVFLSLQSITVPVGLLTEKWQQKREIAVEKYMLMAMVLISALLVAWNDSKFQRTAYIWMMFYICMSGMYVIYEKVLAVNIKLGDMEKIFSNYVFSVISLAPCSYFLGDVINARNFEFFYFYKFYVGCVCSGLFGVLLSLASVRLKERKQATLGLCEISGLAKLLASTLSLVFFKFTLTAGNVFWILVNLVLGLLIGDLDPTATKHSHKEDKDSSDELQLSVQDL